jgi:archaellum component FlaD/FlaE
MGDSKTEKGNYSNFDIGSELSTLVAKNILPKRIADKLEWKLKEKNINLTKEQFYTLVEKIASFLKDYDVGKISPTSEVQVPGATTPKLVKTEDIKTGDWDVDTLNVVPNDPESIIVLMKWLQYLIDKCGRDNLSNILDYYVDIGWISQDVKISLIDYSHGITDEGRTEDTPTRNVSDLPSKDHIRSFIFIQKLKGIELDKHFVDRIDGDITRITKKLDSPNYK